MNVGVNNWRQRWKAELETVMVGLALVVGWTVAVGASFAVTFYLLIPTAVGYGLAARTKAMREKRVFWFTTLTLTVTSAVLFAFMLWVSLNQETVILIQK
jgi:hypothetical protein